jgi:hypothetical protein
MSRPRAADDFASIRARMEELRREREWVQHKPRDELFDRSHVADMPRVMPRFGAGKPVIGPIRSPRGGS